MGALAGAACDGGSSAAEPKVVHNASDDGSEPTGVDAPSGAMETVGSSVGDEVPVNPTDIDATTGQPDDTGTGPPPPPIDAGVAVDAQRAPPCLDEAGLTIDTQSDPHNCAMCGHDCGGGACVSGKCASLPVDVLATGQPSPAGIAVDADNVYWVDRIGPDPNTAAMSGQIMKCAKTGCANAPTVLASGPWSGLSKILVDATNVYWITLGTVYACAIGGCNGKPTAIWTQGGELFDIAISSSMVFFSDDSTLQVLGCALGGCDGGPTLFWSPPGSTAQSVPRALAADTTTLYLGLTSGNLEECTLGSCNGTWKDLVAAQGIANQMVLTGGELYFISVGLGFGSTNGQILKCDASGCGNGPSIVVAGLATPTGLAADATNVYFTDQGDMTMAAQGAGRVAKCPVSGCSGSPTPIAGYVTSPQGIAVDDTRVYWTDFGTTSTSLGTMDGRVMARPK